MTKTELKRRIRLLEKAIPKIEEQITAYRATAHDAEQQGLEAPRGKWAALVTEAEQHLALQRYLLAEHLA